MSKCQAVPAHQRAGCRLATVLVTADYQRLLQAGICSWVVATPHEQQGAQTKPIQPQAQRGEEVLPTTKNPAPQTQLQGLESPVPWVGRKFTPGRRSQLTG